MMIFLLACLGLGAYFYFNRHPEDKARLDQAGQQISDRAGQVRDRVKEKVSEIRAEDIKDELARTGKVIRQKVKQAGNAIADATADGRITATIKGKYAVDRDLSALNISVNTTGGLVTLSGTVSAADLVAKAMNVALETEGVQEVISTLQVKP